VSISHYRRSGRGEPISTACFLPTTGAPCERLTLVRIYEDLRDLGYSGSYDAVRRCARSWNKAQGTASAEAYVPLFFPSGDAYQFDWSHEIVLALAPANSGTYNAGSDAAI
jgi:hypothetical protein